MHLHPIGTLHTPHTDPSGMPIQPPGAAGVTGTAELDADLAAGLADLDGFSHVILIYLFDRASGFDLAVVPFLDSEPRGLFATRAPRRPNPVGLSVVRLVRVEGAVLHLEGVDMLDGTPLLDIKPFVPAFDVPAGGACRTGWLEEVGDRARERRSDGRFG